jgi:hypothetical protein
MQSNHSSDNASIVTPCICTSTNSDTINSDSTTSDSTTSDTINSDTINSDSTTSDSTTSDSPFFLSVDNWKQTKAFTQNKRRESQTQYYVRMNAAPDVVELVSLDSKPFGSVGESIMTELFQMAPRTSSQHDGIFEGHKCEIKCARRWAGKDDCRWQHLEPDHDYAFAMLALLEFHEWKVWCITKAQLMGELREKKVVTFQGKQGWWTLKSAVMPYLMPIHGLECLRKFVSALPK